jgi:hypothetical protein
VVDRGGDVLERRRPTAALATADAAVLDVPDRPPAAGEITRDRSHDDLPVGRGPRPAVDHHDDRVRPGAVGKVEIRPLGRVVAVAVALRTGEQI